MAATYDLGPAAEQVARIADGVDGGRLREPTPCAGWTVGVLLDHLLQLTAAFTAAAEKTPAPELGELDGELPTGWQGLLRERLDALALAWRAPEAWQGEAEAGGVVMPASVMGVVALDELVVHGWDLARATSRPFHADPDSIAACRGFAESMSEPGEEAGREGLYGPVVPVPTGASELDQLIGFTGRDPQWQPAHLS